MLRQSLRQAETGLWSGLRYNAKRIEHGVPVFTVLCTAHVDVDATNRTARLGGVRNGNSSRQATCSGGLGGVATAVEARIHAGRTAEPGAIEADGADCT